MVFGPAAGGQLGARGAFRGRRAGGRHDHDGQRDRHRDGGGDADGPAGPGAPPDGLLDRHVRQAGDGEREADPHRVERPAVDAGPVGADEHDDRPVPQVDAVADRAQHGQRRQRQGLPQRAGGAARDRPDHDQRRHGEHQQAAPVVGRRQPVDGHAHPPDEGERRDRRRGERRRGPALPPGPVERPDRQRRAEEGRRQPGVGAEVGAVGVERVVGDGQQGERHGGAGHGQNEQPPVGPVAVGPAGPAPAAPAQHRQHDQRPHQVELLLDRQAPGVVERRGDAEHVPVADVGQHPVPVGDVPEGGEHVAPEAGAVGLGGEPQQQRRDAHDQHEHGGQQAPRPPCPEPAEADAAGAVVLGDEQRGDQEAGEDEEEVDAEEPAVEAPEVEGDDRGHRQAAQPVEGGLVAQPAARGPGDGRGRLVGRRRVEGCGRAVGRRRVVGGPRRTGRANSGVDLGATDGHSVVSPPPRGCPATATRTAGPW